MENYKNNHSGFLGKLAFISTSKEVRMQFYRLLWKITKNNFLLKAKMGTISWHC